MPQFLFHVCRTSVCIDYFHDLRIEPVYIKTEAENILEKLAHVEKTNYYNLRNKEKDILMMEKDEAKLLDYDSPDNKAIRFQNLKENIYSLQMKQFAESICNIKTDEYGLIYYIQFDPSEKIPEIHISAEEYKEFIKFRDPLNSICVYDLFQENIHSYYNSNQAEKEVIIKEDLNEKFQIAKYYPVSYEYCHHCKQRKPEEYMLKCRSSKQVVAKTKDLAKIFSINGTTIIKGKNILKNNFI